MRHQLYVVYLCPICLTALADTGSKHGNLVQCLDDEVDLRLDRREHEMLLRAVDVLRRHTDRHHVELWILTEVPAALESSVDRLNLHRLAVLLGKRLCHDLGEAAILVLLPARRLRADVRREARERRDRLSVLTEPVELLVNGRTREELDFHLVRRHVDDAEVGARLDEPRDDRRHRVDTRVQDRQEVQQTLCIARRQDLLRRLDARQRHEDLRLDIAVHLLEALLLVFDDRLNLFFRKIRDKDGRRIVRDGVARLAARKGCELDLAFLLQRRQDHRERADGVAAAVADALAGMAAEQALDLDLPGERRLRLHALQLAREVEVDAARAANCQLIVILAVAVDEERGILEVLCREADGALHALLLICRDDQAQRAVVLRRLHDVDGLCHADAIVRAEARALSREVLLRAHELDGILERIVIIAFFRHADHVHVALQDGQRRLLEASRRLLVRDDVVRLVLHDRKAELAEIRLQEITDSLLVTGFARDSSQLGKLREHALEHLVLSFMVLVHQNSPFLVFWFSFIYCNIKQPAP